MSSQNSEIISRLKRYGWIDLHVAREMLGVNALSQRIGEIKKRGYDIETEMVEFTNRHKRKGKFARYRLVS